MGTVKGKFIKGKVGSVIYREYRGSQLIQGIPKKIKSHLTEGTKNAAKTFGKASKLARGMRWSLLYVCHKFYDGTMIYRLNAEILRCINAVKDPETQLFNFNADSFASLKGFEFNVGSMVKNNFFVQPAIRVEGTTLQITIPEIKIPSDLKWPIDRPKCCKLVIVASMIDLKKGLTELAKPQVMDIPYSYTPSVVASQTFDFEVVPGCLCITAISLQYIEETFIGENTINSKAFNPSAILHTYIADGVTDPLFTKNWHEFDGKGYIS
jgi:hypothetical protein